MKKEYFYKNYNGAFDDRPEQEKQKDYEQKEIVACTNDVNWINKKKSEFRSFKELNQRYTNKCVAFTLSKLASISYWLKTGEYIDFSPSFIYEHRSNKSAGMIGVDAFDIWCNYGIPLESACLSKQENDTDIVNINEFNKQVAQGFLGGKHIGINNGDFDSICSTIQTTGKGIMVWFYFTHEEWSRCIPKIIEKDLISPYDSRASRHSVTAVDFGILDGKEVIKIEDSAHFGNISERYITREFFEKRNFFNRYQMNFKYEVSEVITPTIITGILKKGMKDKQVIELQKILQQKGYFPSNIDCTGYFGSITEKSVKNFQKESGLVADGIVGAKTIAKLLS